MNNAVFVKTIENVKKHRDINLVTTKGRRNYLEGIVIEQKNFQIIYGQ